MPITNNYIKNQLLLASSLMELHGENSFKAKTYNSAAQIIDNTIYFDLNEISVEQLETVEGIGKKVASVIIEIAKTGSFDELNQLINITPKGVIEMLNIKGLGAKKIATLWKDLGIEDLESLVNACKKGTVAKQKGFGEKTQEKVLSVVQFTLQNKGKKRYADVEELAADIEKELKILFKDRKVSATGELRRACQIVTQLEFIISGEPNFIALQQIKSLIQDNKISSPFIFRGFIDDFAVQITFVEDEKFTSQLFIHSSTEEHLAFEIENQTLLTIASKNNFSSEEEIYTSVNLPYIAPIYREGGWELENPYFSKIIQFNDLKGCLHNHSLYSDGKNSILEMVQQCQQMGYEYFGISDHSKSAFYANGLYEDKIIQQHKEIDALNAQLNNFKIFKSIESDILNDGSLDYNNDVLASFDFIVASIHSNLNMDIDKATNRLIKAIENPYTTMLGHPTGRLLLSREAYPINHKKIIDACATNKVIIEINANPWRLDIDWTWIQYCMEKGVMLSINPDAHVIDGIYDMYYGTLVAQKGGLTKEMCFNTKSKEEVETYFVNIKKEKGV